jgi:phosphoenolpyruvate carboxykinase (GTP)
VNWFRKDADGRFVWPGYGDNMRVLKWMLDRLEGAAAGEDHAFGISPAYDEMNWTGLDFSRQQFAAVTEMDRSDWVRELELHDELFARLSPRVPPELLETRAVIHRRILGD